MHLRHVMGDAATELSPEPRHQQAPQSARPSSARRGHAPSLAAHISRPWGDGWDLTPQRPELTGPAFLWGTRPGGRHHRAP